MEGLMQRSIASLVLENHQIVPVLEKFNIDYCCRGKMNLTDACKEKGIELSVVIKEIGAAGTSAGGRTMPFSEMTEAQLVHHIVIRHHYYVKNAMPLIAGHLEKIAKKHGETHPYMIRVKELFGMVHKEMNLHMQKEELTLFPRIIEMEGNGESGNRKLFPSDYISGPVSVMEQEHENAGDTLFEIRKLTNNYAVPDGACPTFRICLSELKEFEDDLHEHVHLENNILFPKALRLSGAA